MTKANKKNWKPKSFHSVKELQAELDTIEAAHQAGTLSTAGGWTVGQNLEHCTKIMISAFDGFDPDMKVPFPIKLLGKLIFKPMIKNPKGQMKPGIKLPANARGILPADEVSVEDGLAMMRTQLARIDAGEKMLHNSPVMGKMTHELWILMHLNHCRLHFGYFKYE